MRHSEPNSREEIQKRIKYFLQNPGYFSILILGDSGVGKEFILREILKKFEINEKKDEKDINRKEKYFKFYYPFEIGETTEEVLKIFDSDFIIIKSSEELTYIQQDILFKALSTQDGKIGLDKNRGYKRIIFVSSYNVEQLRESKKHWSDRFWDRVAQLVIKIPSFKDFSSNILADFKFVWIKMNFQDFNKTPEDGEFLYWLKNNCGTFAGNFRDLDKIAILWHQYRLIYYKNSKQKFKSDVEARIFHKVRKDFESFTHFPTQKADTSNTFEFEKGKTWEQIERNFKSKFKTWAKESFGTIKQATKELNMPARKMDKW